MSKKKQPKKKIKKWEEKVLWLTRSDSELGSIDWVMDMLVKAYNDARKNGKLLKADAHKFEVNKFTNLTRLAMAIYTRTYAPLRGIAFIRFLPVIREIFAAPFRDRIVHHLLFLIVGDWWDARFVDSSFSCRVGKGTSYGIKRLRDDIRKASKNYTVPVYVIKLDIKGYFMSLSRKKLYERVVWGLDRQFPQKGPLYEMAKFLWRQIIFDNPVRGVKMKGRKSDWVLLEKEKSLFHQKPGIGIVIGNLTSQLLSNIYMDQFDRYVKHVLRYKFYGRYVDDFYLVVTEKQLKQAMKDLRKMELFLKGMGLKLHPKKRHIQLAEKGVEFLGVVIYPRRVVPGKRVTKNFKRTVRLCAMGVVSHETLAAYVCYLEGMNGRRLIKREFEKAGWDYVGWKKARENKASVK